MDANRTDTPLRPARDIPLGIDLRLNSGIDLRIAAPAIAAWLAAAVVIAYPSAAVATAAAAWTLSVVLMVAAACVRRGRCSGSRRFTGVSATCVAVAVVLAAIALISSSAAVHSGARHPAVLASIAKTGEAVTVTATTTELIVGGHFAAVATSVRMASGDTQNDIALDEVPILIFGDVQGERIGIGTAVKVTGSIVGTAPEDDVSYLMFAADDAVVVRSPPWFLGWANNLRTGFARESAALPGDGAALMPGLAIGDTSAVDESLDSAMKASSLSHLTAVSGANCAIIIGLILAAGAAVGMGRTSRVLAALAVLAAFVVLVTPEPSVLRAAVMATLVLAAYASGRPAGGLPILGTAVLVLLALDPWLARSYGFALSVLATGGLLLLAAPLSRVLARWMPTWLAVVVAVPLAAQIACQPVLILLDASVPVYGVLANLLAAPAAPPATVIGLVACVAAALVPPLGSLLAQCAWLPAAWIAAVARFFADLPLARIPWPAGALGAAVMVLLTTLLLVAVLSPLSEPWRRRLVFTTAAALVVVLAAVGGARLGATRSQPGHWQIAACDVGQGDASVVRSGAQVSVIDTGPDAQLLSECLENLGIDHINLLILSHFDFDHVGGTAAVVGLVDRVIVGPTGESSDDDLVRSLVDGGAVVDRVSRGASGILGELRWRVLWPPARLGDVESGNDASVTVRFDPAGDCLNGCLNALFLGDLSEDSQNRMLSSNRGLGSFDVVKVSHHGSADQSAKLYRQTAATVGLIGVGSDNDYGHPARDLLHLLDSVGTAVARTDQDGLVLVAPSGGGGGVLLWLQHARVGAGD